MTEWLARIFAGRPWTDIFRDIVDVLIVAFVIYRALLVVRGTRAMQMGVGLGVIFLLYLGAKVLNLVTLVSLLSYLLSSIILIVVVVFQNDIRRALIRVGGQAWLGRGRKQEQSRVIDEVVAAVTECARHRIGAIIAFEQDANLLEFTKREGTVIGAAVTRELLVALFYPESVNKLHDGAVIIRDLKIARAGVFFPMPDTKLLDKSLGTRHSAALGITEETDAVVVVVSEERGTISFCFNGNIVPNLDGTALRQTLVGLLGQKNKKAPIRIAPPRQTAAPAQPSPRADASSKSRDSVLATPLPGSRPSMAPRGASPLPIRPSLDHDRSRSTDARSTEMSGDMHRSSTMPLLTSKPMPRSSVMPPPSPARDDRAFEAPRSETRFGHGDGPDSDRHDSPETDRSRRSERPALTPSPSPVSSRAPVSTRSPPSSDRPVERGDRASLSDELSEGDRISFVPKMVPAPPDPSDPVSGGGDS